MNKFPLSLLALVGFSSFFFVELHAQETEFSLLFNPEKAKDTELRLERSREGSLRSASTLTLPIIDDFSQDHFPGNADGNEVFYTDLSASLYHGFGIAQPSIGVAVFDGLDALGMPYDFSNPQTYGRADSLCSEPIDLSGANSVVMSFFFQPQGVAFAQPQPDDSLTLDFYSPSEDRWIRQWHANGTPGFPYSYVAIAIDEEFFLEDGFRFCFSNYATLSGSLNQWSVDWIYIDDNRSTEDDVLVDVGFAEREHTLLTADYTSMPWKHFVEAPDAQMAPILPITLKNNNDAGAFIPENGYSVEFNGGEIHTFENDTTPNVPVQSSLDIIQAVTTAPSFFTYPTNVATDSASFDVEFSFSTSPDLHIENNRMSFTQHFKDYYAYDDGSAETGYGLLNAPGGRVAYAFDIIKRDTLRGFDMYFLPISINIDDELIFLTVWADENGQPGEELYQDISSRTPDYTELFQFKEYTLEDTLILDPGRYYIGWAQPGSLQLAIGNDKNIDNNSSRLFFRIGSNWSQSSVSGTLLMRPVFGPPPTAPPVSLENWANGLEFDLSPNPSDGIFNLSLGQDQQAQYEVFDMQGRRLTQGIWNSGRALDLRHLASGQYLLRLFSNTQQGTQRIVIQH